MYYFEKSTVGFLNCFEPVLDSGKNNPIVEFLRALILVIYWKLRLKADCNRILLKLYQERLDTLDTVLLENYRKEYDGFIV